MKANIALSSEIKTGANERQFNTREHGVAVVVNPAFPAEGPVGALFAVLIAGLTCER